MTTQTGLNHYQKGLELASAGRHKEGLNCIREHLRMVPHDAQALNDAGAILHCLRRLRGTSSRPIWRVGGPAKPARCSTAWSRWAFSVSKC